MDLDLLLALIVMWVNITAAITVFFSMWFFNNGETFHPHSVDIDHRHSLLAVVHSDSCCKRDCIVKSISCFVAPRGSSCSKFFTVIVCMISASGIFGTFRWYRVGDPRPLEALCAALGFCSLLLVAFFELVSLLHLLH